MLKNLYKLTVIAVLSIIFQTALAQEKGFRPKEFKFGKIDPLEFGIKPEGGDSAASAVAIFDMGRGYFDFTVNGPKFIMERHTRYKIINKNGYDYANLEIQLYKSSNGESILTNVEASTYNMEGDKMVVSKIGKDAKFTEKRDKNYSIRKLALPNVKEGSIIEFKYKYTTDFFFTLRPWYFQRSIPTLHSEYIVSVPDYWNYKANPAGLLRVDYRKEAVTDGTVYHYAINDVPGLRDESYVASMDDYLSRVEFELSSVSIPGQTYKDFTSTWPKIIKMIKGHEDFGGFINKTAYAKSLLPTILKNETNQDSIVCKIFNYVKNNVKWNDDYDLYANEASPKNVLEKKAGSSADINLLLLNILKAAKITASPVLLSTRDNGMHPGLPMLTAFNNVIVDATIGEKHILLDATHKHHSLNLIGYNNLNHEGLSVDLENETSSWISLEKDKVSGKSYTYMLTLTEENKLAGKLYINSTDYEALSIRNKYSNALNQAEFLKNYKSDKPGLGLKNYQILNLDNPDEPLTESMDIEIEDNVEEGGELAFFTPLLYEKTKENPFKLETRNFPVDFAFPTEETFRISIDLPKNYTVDKLPKSEKFVLPNQSASFSFIFAQAENKIGLTSKITLKKSLFTPEEYFELKELFKNIVRKQAEQIVIKKS